MNWESMRSSCLTHLLSRKKLQVPEQGLKFCWLAYGRYTVFLLALKINVRDCSDINISEVDVSYFVF